MNYPHTAEGNRTYVRDALAKSYTARELVDLEKEAIHMFFARLEMGYYSHSPEAAETHSESHKCEEDPE